MTTSQSNQLKYIYDRINNMDIDLITETLTVTDNVGNNVIKSYDFEFSNGENDIEALFLYLTAGNGTSCRTIYVPKLSIYQFINGVTSRLNPGFEVNNDSNILYRSVYFTKVDGNKVTVYKGGNYNNGDIKLEVTALYR